MTSILPNGKTQYFNSTGVPLAGGSVYFYIPNTSTPKTTWQDSGQFTPNSNPVILDAAGEALIWGAGQYRQVVQDSLGNTIWDQITAEPQPTLSGTSLTTNTIGTGSKTFVTQAGIALSAGQFVIIIDSANSANYVSGQITSYSNTTLIVNVTSTGGSGTKSSWNIYLTGVQGPPGPAPVYFGTSITSLTPTSGAITFTTQSGLSFSAGQFISAVSNSTPSAYFIGNITSYSGTTLVMNATSFSGSGAHTDWNISLSAAAGNLSGDVTSIGLVTTIANVNSNVGSFSNANVTVNAKGQVTAASSGSAPYVKGTSLILNPYSTSATGTQAHGIGSTPNMILMYLENISAEAGYSVGERIPMIGSSGGFQGATIVASVDATNTYYNTNTTDLPDIVNKSGFARQSITPSKWMVVIIPVLF